MSMKLIILVTIMALLGCLSGMWMFKKKSLNIIIKIILGLIITFIFIWLLWVAAMVFFVGPGMRRGL